MNELIEEKRALVERKVCQKRFREKVDSFGVGINERKSLKTNVFSGISKAIRTTKTLKELCYDKLSQRLDKLVINEDIPYLTIRPVLAKCCANQLQTLEALNPSLVPKTDDLWFELCKNEFHFTANTDDQNYYNNCVPNKTSAENWQQFYCRSISFRKRKLDEITASIRDKNYSIKSNQRLIKVCETETNKLIKLEPIPHKKVIKTAPLMKKCLRIKKQKFML